MSGQRSISLFSTTVALLLVFQLFCTATFAFGLTNVKSQTEWFDKDLEASPTHSSATFDNLNFNGIDEVIISVFKLGFLSFITFKSELNVVLGDFEIYNSSVFPSWSAKALPKVFRSIIWLINKIDLFKMVPL